MAAQVKESTTGKEQGHFNFGNDITEDLPKDTSRNIACSSTTSITISDPTLDQAGDKNRLKMALNMFKSRLGPIFLDIIILLAVVALFLIIELNVIPVYKRGFFCDDRTIIYKYTGDTVSPVLLFVVAFLTLPLIWLVEYMLLGKISNGIRWRSSLIKSSFVFKEYFIGQILQLAIICTIKTLYGAHRPHFLDTCRPDLLDNCTPGEFVTNFKCLNTEVTFNQMIDSMKSFPSGHSSTSTFQAIFTIMYLYSRIPKQRSFLMVPIVQLTIFSWALFCSISRITDYRHHWWDVLFGMIIGIIGAILTCVFVCKNFKSTENTSTETVVVHMNGNSRVTYNESNQGLLEKNQPENLGSQEFTFRCITPDPDW